MDQRFLLPLLLLGLVLAACVVAWCQAHSRGHRVHYEDTDFRDAAGFRVLTLPQDATITYGDIWLIDSAVGEMRFEIDPFCPGILRTAIGGTELQLEDFCHDYDAHSIYEENGTRVMFHQNPGGPYLFTWSRGGFDHALYFPAAEMGLAGGLSHSFVLKTISSQH